MSDAEQLKQQYTALIEREQPMLTLFSGDQRLEYQLDDQAQTFVLLPKERKVEVPFIFFQSQEYDQNRFLFHLYQTLALYPDYQRAPERYLGRTQVFRPEAEEMAAYFLAKVQKAGLSDDKAYTPVNVYYQMQDEIETFLEQTDSWVSVLMVKAQAPVYAVPAVSADIGKMLLLEDTFPQEDNPLAIHRDLAGSLLVAEFYGIDEIGSEAIRRALREMVFGKERYDFLRQQILRFTAARKGIEERDPFLHTFLFPVFKALWKQDIDRMELSRTIEEEQETDATRKARRRRSPNMRQSDRQKMLQELKEEKDQRAKSTQRLLSGRPDLSEYGVSEADQKLFAHYEAVVKPAREAMKRYWQKMIGEASREVSVRVENRPKGRLDVEALIQSWPSFTEAEREQNYKGLTVFAAYELQRVTKELPQYMDISFVIDNSGSMRSGKLEPARQALAAVLLSLQDFAGYLEENAARTHQRSEVRVETWLFGTTSRRVLSFDDLRQKKTANIIRSITRLDGTDGTTDDGQCLENIQKELTPQMIREQAAGHRIRLIFEVTDGASSFPGTTKRAVEALHKAHAHIQAIEVGSAKDAAARETFQYIFGDHGLFLGDEITRLPEELMKTVQKEISKIFRR